MADVQAWGNAAGVLVERIAPLPIRILRLRTPTPSVLARVSDVLSAAVPVDPNTTSGTDPTILWLSPGEWMIIGGSQSSQEIVEAASGAVVAHLADISDGRICYEVRGPLAREVIAKGCTIDLHPRVFGPGRCAQSALAQTFVVIHQTSEQPAFQIHADASYSNHLDLWFDDALLEFNK